MAIIIGATVARTTVMDLAGSLQLRGAYGVTPVAVGGETIVYVAGLMDGGVSAFRLGADGSLDNRFNVDDGSSGIDLELRGATRSTSITLDGQQYLYVVGSTDDGLSAFRINEGGTLTNIQNIDDKTDVNLQLDGPSGRLGVATVGGTTFLVVSGDDDNGLTVFRVNGDGTLAYASHVTDDPVMLNLHDAHDVVTAEVGGRSFVYVIGGSDDGISVFDLAADGTLTNTFNLTDDPVLQIANPWGLAKAAVDGAQYLIASGRDDDGLSVFAMNDGGTLTNVFNLHDDAARGLDGVIGVTTFVLEGETFVMASGTEDSALTIFHLGAGGVLTDVTTIFDTAASAIGYTVENAFALVDGHALLIATGDGEDGVSTFELGGGDDVLTGTAEADLILGFAGSDRLDGGGGADRLIGGIGDDIYVVRGSGEQIIEREGGGTDTVESSLSDYALAAEVENLVLVGSALAGTGNGLANRITGNDQANLLQGLDGNDRLFGAAGRDRLLGGDGKDRLVGGQGADSLMGGRDRDVLIGGQGADAFVFVRVGDSGPSKAKRDHIDHFGKADVINLKAIDADRTKPGNQAFHLQGDDTFQAGDIQVKDTRGGTLLLMNLDRDAKPEMSILLADFHGDLHRSDFLL